MCRLALHHLCKCRHRCRSDWALNVINKALANGDAVSRIMINRFHANPSASRQAVQIHRYIGVDISSGASPMFAQGLAKSEINPMRVNGVNGKPSTNSRFSLIHTRRCAFVPMAPVILRMRQVGSVLSPNSWSGPHSSGGGTDQLAGFQMFPGEFSVLRKN